MLWNRNNREKEKKIERRHKRRGAGTDRHRHTLGKCTFQMAMFTLNYNFCWNIKANDKKKYSEFI